jgi:hypothetical protein
VWVRSLVVVIVLSLISWFVATAAVVYSVQRSSEHRKALIEVVCESVLIREEYGDPLASVYRARFNAVLSDIGERCPPRR